MNKTYKTPTAVNNEGMRIVYGSDTDDCIYRAYLDGLPVIYETLMELKFGFIEEEISMCYVCVIEALTGEGILGDTPKGRYVTEFGIGQVVSFGVFDNENEKIALGPIKMEVVEKRLFFPENGFAHAKLTLKQVP